MRLTFGCRSSPSIFNSVSEVLCWILLNRVRIPSVLHLLDDFLPIDPPHDSSGSSLSKLKHCFHALGVPLSDQKTIGPDTRLEFLGIILDSIEMKASLPTDKLQRIRDITKPFCAVETIIKQQLLSLLCHLNFAKACRCHHRNVNKNLNSKNITYHDTVLQSTRKNLLRLH